MRIYLIGMPGSGKTTLGKSLAKLFHYTFIDLDARIEQTEGIPIKDIFSQKGETYFRQLESSILKNTALDDNIVVATGGGAPCFFDNIDFINQSGVSIFLDIALIELQKRLSVSKTKPQLRPLFAGKSSAEMMETLQAMWLKREPFYRRATIIVDSRNAKAEKIVQLLKEHAKR